MSLSKSGLVRLLDISQVIVSDTSSLCHAASILTRKVTGAGKWSGTLSPAT